jgi:hypothetical protein
MKGDEAIRMCRWRRNGSSECGVLRFLCQMIQMPLDVDVHVPFRQRSIQVTTFLNTLWLAVYLDKSLLRVEHRGVIQSHRKPSL